MTTPPSPPPFSSSSTTPIPQVRVLHRSSSPSPPPELVSAACVIQRAWQSFTQRRIYRYFRDLIRARERSDPFLLVRSLNAREGSLVDVASGLYVRLRLGGTEFPPNLYYKIYTKTRVTDIGAFAPRDYARERVQGQRDDDADGWYAREERNGWRLVTGDRLSSLHELDEVERATHAQRVRFHYSPVVRRQDVIKRRKAKKRAWLRKMYGMQPAQPMSPRPASALHDVAAADEDDLVAWSQALDFEAYQDEWASLATSEACDAKYRQYQPEVDDEYDPYEYVEVDDSEP